MAGISIKTEVKGIPQLTRVLNVLTRKIQSRTDLNARWAVLTLNWINRNFATEGGMVGGWKPLSPNTLAARRSGAGRILQDTGRLRASFIPRWNDKQASVGSAISYSRFHEEGTGPYTIKPKGNYPLRFKVAQGSGAVKTKILKSGKKISLTTFKGQYVFAREVHHPGLPQRRMLPQQGDPVLMRDLLRASVEYLKKTEG